MQKIISQGDNQFFEQSDSSIKVLSNTKKLQGNEIQNNHILSNISNRQTILPFIKQQIKSGISIYLKDFQQDLKSIRNILEIQRKNTQTLFNEVSTLKCDLYKNIQNPLSKHQVTLKRVPSTQSNSSDIKILHLESQILLLSSKFEEFNKKKQIQKSQNQGDKITKQIIEIKNLLSLEVGNIRDGLIDIEDNFRIRVQKLQLSNNILFNSFQQAIDDLTQKNRNIAQVIDRNSSENDKNNRQLQTSLLRLDKIQKIVKQIDNDFDQRVDDCRKLFQNRLIEGQQLFQNSLQKVIVPYNSNFEQMDKNFSQIKQIVIDVLKFTKALGDKLVIKLNNTIDTNTFQKTIQNLNESFSETYLLNTQKIKQLNQKEYEVYHELNQVKDVLEHLKVEYKSSNKINDNKEIQFDKKITSLGDLGIDSDGDYQEFKEQNIKQIEQTNPFKRRVQRQPDESFY